MLILYISTILDALIFSWALAYQFKYVQNSESYNIFGLRETKNGIVYGDTFGSLIYILVSILCFSINMYIAIRLRCIAITGILFIGALCIYLYNMYNTFGKINRLIDKIMDLHIQIRFLNEDKKHEDLERKYSDCFEYNNYDVEIGADGKLQTIHTRDRSDKANIKDTVKTNFRNAKNNLEMFKRYIFNNL